MSTMGPHAHLVITRAARVPHEDTLLGVIAGGRVHSAETARVTTSCVDGKSTVDVSAGLIELDGLPSILGCLTDAWTSFSDSLLLMLALCLGLLILNVTLDLILAETQRQVEFEGLIILSRLRLLKASLISVGCVARATFGGTAWVLRAMVVRGAICGRGRRRGEETRLCTSLV